VSVTPQAPDASSSDDASRAAVGPYYIPQQQGAGNVPPWPHQPQGPAPRQANSAATAGFVIALVAAIVACIPLLGTISWLLAPVGIVFAIVGLTRATPSRAAVGRSMAIWGIALGVLALIICSIYVSAIARSARTSSSSYSAPDTYSAPAPSYTYSPPSYSSGSSSGSYSSSSGGSYTTPAADPNTFSAGTYEVGTEIQPGTYKTTGSSWCYWERDKDASGEFSSIISNGNSNGPGIVTVKSSDGYVEFSGTCTWTKK
jgi:hypothetical protein